MDSTSAIADQIIGNPKKIVITMHINPDADALGASLGLALFLKKNHHSVSIISPNNYPDFLDWLPGISTIISYEKPSEQEAANQLIAAADIIFCVDFAMIHRIDKLGELVKNAAAKKIVIDHHLDIEHFADLMFWRPTAAASAELVYDLILALGKKDLMDKKIAECLYVGILTDTASFKTPNTTPHVHHVVAQLLEFGIDVNKISQLVYENNSLNKIRFLGFVLSKRLTVLPAYKTAYLAISMQDAKAFNLKAGDTEGLVNYPLSIKGISLAALLKEREQGVYLSLRSTGDFAVNTFAKQHFEGGGHKNAAGGISHLPLQDTITKFETLVKLDQLSTKHELLKK
jgi:phosphoesterase RecJ-like protein